MRGWLVLVLAQVAVGVIHSPVIGVLGLPQSEGCITRRRAPEQGDAQLPLSRDSGFSCFSAYYSLWLQQAGARVVPLRYNMSDAEIAFFAPRLNGVLFTGGELTLSLDETYVVTARKWLRVATDPSMRHDPLPLWGTCQGFQLLHILVANSTSALCTNCYDSEDVSWPLNLTRSAPLYSMYSQLFPQSLHALATQPITMNFHVSGIPPSLYDSSSRFPQLREFFTVLSTNLDRKGRAFVSSVQAKDWPIFAVQYHPERPAFEFSNLPGDVGLVHTRAAVQTNNELAIVFVERARQSRRKFASFEEAIPYLLYNYVPRYLGQSDQLFVY